MAIQVINIGNIANDGTGDDLREAFLKVNQNFQELYNRDPEGTTAENILDDSEGIAGIFSEKTDYLLKFKNLVAGTGISLTSSTNTVTINNVADTPIIVSESGSVDIGNYGNVLTITSDGTQELTSISNNELTIKTRIVNDPNPVLSASLDVGGFNILNAGDIYGTFRGTIGSVDYDYGAISQSQVNSVFDLIFLNTDTDFGNFGYDPYNLDLGSI